MLRAFLVLCLFSTFGVAETFSPVGKWRTIDDESKKPRGIVEITQEPNGKLIGKILEVFPKAGEPDIPICINCTGERKNQFVVGMIILWDVEKRKSDWGNGKILDPENGKIYRVKISVIDAGKRLKVRGYIGFSIFGRTQHWERVSP